ncbi:unnamed protein product [Somion occarium]|uniref:Protein kinase domain-containing protein n=1 Tax=Somion occarium TaxID=3059160 RepID=A0ABP1DEL9_9APHY
MSCFGGTIRNGLRRKGICYDHVISRTGLLPGRVPTRASWTVRTLCILKTLHGHILDATRISDGEIVMLKRISHLVHPHEKELSVLFSSEPLRFHPRNHCVPLYEVLDLSEDQIGEVFECFRQVIEGLQFMLQCRVAHRDCMTLNIMMDPHPMFPQSCHPMATTWNRDFTSPANTRVRKSICWRILSRAAIRLSYNFRILSILRTHSQSTFTTLEMLPSMIFWRDALDLSFLNRLLTTWCRPIRKNANDGRSSDRV